MQLISAADTGYGDDFRWWLHDSTHQVIFILKEADIARWHRRHQLLHALGMIHSSFSILAG